MFWTRAIVSLTLAPLAALIIFLGRWPLFLAVTLLLVLGSFEFDRIMRHHGWRTSPWLIAACVFLLLVSAQWPSWNATGPFLFITMGVMLVDALWAFERRRTQTATMDMLANISGALLLGWLGRYILLLRQLDDAGQWALIVVATIWLSDTFAYIIGSRFGRRRITPNLSPKKSLEGYIGGIILGIGSAALFKFLFLPLVPWTATLLLGVFLTPVLPLGDLGFSLLKREAGVKDSGRLFPGHGGVLDRFDTLLWGGALAYYLIVNFLM